MITSVLAWIARAALIAAIACCSISAPGAAVAQGTLANAGSVSGIVRASDGTPVANATITLSGAGTLQAVRSDAHGDFIFVHLVPQTYDIEARATGYTTLTGRTIAVREREQTSIELTLPRAQAASLIVIGDVTANGHPALSTAPAPNVNINAQQYAAEGVTRVSDILQDELSTTVVPVIGGGLNAPAVVALRGPDPSETLVDVDGHQVNNGSTGDFDLSLLDPAELQNVQVLYGIAPSTLFGPNTLGGALNVITLEPTTDPHTLERFTAGSYNTYGGTLQATGTDDRLGYAFSLHRVTSGGQFNNYLIPNDDDTGYAPIGNDMSASSAIAKLRYALTDGGFIGFSVQNQAVYRDLSATLSSVQLPQDGSPDGLDDYSNFSGSGIQSVNTAYDFDAQLPLGHVDAGGIAPVTAIFRHQTSFTQQSVFGPGSGTSPYLYNDRDLITDDTLEFDRQLAHGTLSVKFVLTNENLITDFIPGVVYANDVAIAPPPFMENSSTGITAQSVAMQSASLLSSTIDDTGGTDVPLAQTQRWMGIRYTLDPTAKLHYSFATYFSDYSTFGHSIDPRFGFVWTPNADSTLRASFGTTFQSPQLPTFIVPSVLPAPVDGYVSIGNPNATAERSTEYDLGYEHLFHVPNHDVHVALDLYRTDLHNGVATYYSPTQCVPGVNYGNNPPCLSYPVNVTREVYEGVEFRSDVALHSNTLLHLNYDIDSVYTAAYPAAAADDVPIDEQALGVPLHKIELTLEHNSKNPTSGFSYYGGILYEGDYNELNLPPYATVRAGITAHLRDFDAGLYGENLTDAYNFGLTRIGGGVIYGGLPGAGNGPVPTDALPLAGPQLTLVITHHL